MIAKITGLIFRAGEAEWSGGADGLLRAIRLGAAGFLLAAYMP